MEDINCHQFHLSLKEYLATPTSNRAGRSDFELKMFCMLRNVSCLSDVVAHNLGYLN